MGQDRLIFRKEGIWLDHEGRIIGQRYRIIRKLGEGGKGSVYLVFDQKTEVFWAAKRIEADQDGAFHEAEMLKSLKNHHLPQFIDFFREDGYVWLIMEHIRGICYSHYLQNGGSLSEEQVLSTGIQTAEALVYLQGHSPPVYHLDIKPDNLLRTRRGTVKLVDFGAAWKRDTTAVNEGTEGFAAPEQYDSKAPKDGRTDIYGLGATLYCLASGKKYSKTLKHSQVPGLGEELSRVIMICLQEKPEDRYQSAEELLSALIRIRRKYAAEKKRRQLLLAMALALPAAAFCSSLLPDSLDLTKDEKWNYDKLLTEARCVSEDESREYYRKAVFMQPDNPKAYLQLLDDFGGDGRFSEKEETFLRNLLHTVPLGEKETNEELLQKQADSYGEIADKVGMVYRYEYPGQEGKRIAAGWFQKAAGAGQGMSPPLPEWLSEAEYYVQLGKLEQVSADAGETEDNEVSEAGTEQSAEELSRALRFWDCLKDGKRFLFKEDNSLLKLQRLQDTLWQLVFQTDLLCESKISPKEIREQAEAIVREADRTDGGKAGASIRQDMSEAENTLSLRLKSWEKSAGTGI